jgi:hypothetical protein
VRDRRRSDRRSPLCQRLRSRRPLPFWAFPCAEDEDGAATPDDGSADDEMEEGAAGSAAGEGSADDETEDGAAGFEAGDALVDNEMDESNGT